jgi:hypothetical protein
MRLARLLLYALAALAGLYVLAAALYAIPMISGLVDDTMEVKFPPKDCLADTSETGEGNGGHLWGTDLSESDRMAVLEYLKTY